MLLVKEYLMLIIIMKKIVFVMIELNMFINNKTGRRPMILPVIMEIKK